MQAAIKTMLCAVILAAMITLCSCGGPADIGYREGMAERSSDFNADWLFMLEPEGTPQLTDYDDNGWRELDLPHDWSIELDFSSDVATGVGALPGGTGWYRKYFVLPEAYEGKRISVEFDGVYCNSTVFVNGKSAGFYPNGYVPFSYDITDLVICDGVTENVIAVRVKNPTGEQGEGVTSRWYTGSGIYRDVRLTVTESVHISKWGTHIRTPKLEREYEKGKVTVEAAAEIVNESDKEAAVSVRQTLLNYDGSPFSGSEPKTSGKKKLKPGESAELTVNMTAKEPQLWSLDSPTLYIMRTEVISDGEIVDTYYTRFGFRWFEFDPDDGFSLNGEYMKLNGVCLHHDQGALGAVANESAMQRQLGIMKEMGANAVRTSHNAADPDFIRLCDEMGLLVMEESFDSWWEGKNEQDYSRQWFMKPCTYPGVGQDVIWAQFDIQSIVKKDRNSPCVILWGIGNEVSETNSADNAEFAARLAGWVSETDPDRPAAMGENKFKLDWGNADGIAANIDAIGGMAGLNYGEAYYDSLHAEHPDWKIFGSECCSAFKSRGYYSSPWINGSHVTDNVMGNQAEEVTRGQVSSYDNSSARYGRNAAEAWIFNRDRRFIAGVFLWTGFDYIGEPAPYYGTSKSSYFGAVDTAGFPKDEYYLWQSVWTDAEEAPMVHILPHWNWENEALRKKVTYPDKSELEYLDRGETAEYSDEDVGKIPIRVYSNAPAVELFLNGESLGRKNFAVKTTDYGLEYRQQSETSEALYLEWALEWSYEAGTVIEAVAYGEDGNEIARDKVVTAGKAAKIRLAPEKTEITADGRDLCYIEVDITDEDGNFMPLAENLITFEIEGDGKIVGVDNGNAVSQERYKDTDGVWKRKAFSGKALVIVQSTKDAGSFTVTARSDGLESDSATVFTVKKGQD